MMMQSHSPSTIATAPEIPSSSNMATYYDPRSSSNYYQQVNSTNQQMYMPPSTHSSAAAAAAAVAAASLSSTSLPPLSQLLPPPAASVESSHPASHSQSQAVISKINSHQQQQEQHNPMNVPSNATPDYFNSQAPISERTNRSMSAASFTTSQQDMAYRKSIDGQRSMYAPTVTNDLSRRNYISTHDSPDSYYLLQQQHPQQHHHHHQHPNGGEAPPMPQYPPQQHPNTAVVPPSDLSMFPTPHPSLSQYHRTPHYHLPSPPTSVIDGVLMTDPHSIQGGINANSQKVFSFVPLPGLNQKKRPRRKYHEVERLYRCNYQDCNKSYGTLNHLNAHVSMQRHGAKRQPSEFKELRKMWRKQKRENKQRNAAAAAAVSANGKCSSVSSIETQHQMPSDDELIQKNDLCDYSSIQHYQPSLLSHSSPWHPSSQPGYMPTY